MKGIKKGLSMWLIRIFFCHVLSFRSSCLETDKKALKQPENEKLKSLLSRNCFYVLDAIRVKDNARSIVFSHLVLPARYRWIWMRFSVFFLKKVFVLIWIQFHLSYILKALIWKFLSPKIHKAASKTNFSISFLGKQSKKKGDADGGCIEGRKRRWKWNFINSSYSAAGIRENRSTSFIIHVTDFSLPSSEVILLKNLYKKIILLLKFRYLFYVQ